MMDRAARNDLSHLGTIAERLEKVEKENRTLKRLSVAVLALVGALAWMGQSQGGRVVEAERFILKDQEGRTRAEINMQPSGEPALEFFGKEGKRQSSLGGGDLMFLSEKNWTRVASDGLLIEQPQGHIDLGGGPGEWLRLKITSTTGPISGFAALGMQPGLALGMHPSSGGSGPVLVLFGNKGQGYAELNTVDGGHLHMDPGMWQGKLLPGGSVDINAKEPSIAIADQEGFSAQIGRCELKDKYQGKPVRRSTASIVLAGKDRVLWTAP